MLYEIHMLKNYPPTNLNRDDSGSPKSCIFGGTTRGRISSQCLKRSWRTSPVFCEEVGASNLGIRTRKLPVLVKDKLIELGIDPAIAEASMPVISGLGTKDGKPTDSGTATAQVVFYAPDDIDAVAAAVFEVVKDCSSAKEVSKKLTLKGLLPLIAPANIRPVSLDIALWGRMVTDETFRNVEASMQVAHAISTNKQMVESDFFTAMDDLLDDNSAEGKAAHLNDQDYNSSCYYVYASVDSDQLRDNLCFAEDPDEIVRKAIPAMLRAMAFTNPSGKQNSFAGHVLPDVVMVECKQQKIPTSMVNAFENPVFGSKGVALESAKRLADEADMISRNFGLQVNERLWFCVDKYDVAPETATKVCRTFQELTDAVAATL